MLLKPPSCLSFFGLFIILVSCSYDKPIVMPPEMWGDLEQGSYRVGFKTIFLHDISRPPIPYSDWEGNLFPTKEIEGRQMQINVWYPANMSPGKERLRYEYYVHLLGRQIDFGELDEQSIDFANQQLMKKVNALGANGRFTQASLDSLKDLETHAFLGATASDGQFPLIVFPNGTSPAIQSIECEYLASHGFVVAAMGLKGEHAYTEDISVRGMETAVIDLDFAIQNLVKLPFVDNERLGLIGNAITSSQIVAYLTRNANVDCIVSLEGGLLSGFEQNLLDQTAFYDAHAVDKPILAIYAPHPSIDPSHIYHLKYADRYFYHFPQMTEFHFLNFGQFERLVPDILGNHDGDVQKGFETASLYILKFMDAFLNDNPGSEQFLEQDVSAEFQSHIDTAFIRRALPTVPNIAVVKNGYINYGFQYIDSIYREHKTTNPAPFSKSFYMDMRNWLAWQKDPEYRDRYQLYKLAYDSYPESAEINDDLSYYAVQLGHYDEAKEHIHKALSILESNENQELTLSRKERIRTSLLELLSQVNE